MRKARWQMMEPRIIARHPGFSGADLANPEMKLLAARGRRTVSMAEFEEAGR